MSVNYNQGHVPGVSSIPKRPSQQSGQQPSNTKWSVVPPKRWTSISTQDADQPESLESLEMQDTNQLEAPIPLEMQDTDQSEPLVTQDSDTTEAPVPLETQVTDQSEPLAPLATQDVDKSEPLVPPVISNSLQTDEVDRRSSLAEMATTRLDAAPLMDIPQPHTPLVWKKIKVSYTATVNVRKAKKRGRSQKRRISSPAF